MSENDIIAEYVKERFPEILETFDFKEYTLLIIVREGINKLFETLEKPIEFLQKVLDT